MRRIFFGFFVALAVSILLTLITSLLVCLGAHPLLFEAMDGATPVLGIFAGAYLMARGDWRVGVGIAALFVAGWLVLWLYLEVRWDLLAWVTEGLGSLTLAHFVWWLVALAAGGIGGALSRVPRTIFAAVFAALLAGAVMFAVDSLPATHESPASTVSGAEEEETICPEADGTLVWLHTFHFETQVGLHAGVYDCDSEGPHAYSDANTSYLCQDLAALTRHINEPLAPNQQQVLCLVNGGFFGGSGWSVSHHEEPMVRDHAIHYPVDLLRPKDQAWFLGMNSTDAVEKGGRRLEMAPALPPDARVVLGGVRPLRVAGNSLELKPGAGVTTLKCSRTSIGWSKGGTRLYVLTVFDPDGELASQLQRRGGGHQTGGWDVRQVQQFWEDRDVPNAVLFDGGESTQAAFRRADGSYFFVPSGYQYSFTLGYFRGRPLRFTLPILPPAEAHRGVLNYFYVLGPAAENAHVP